ncbi:hypothetical protein JCM19236_1276 [Vibrio sp. JCM 19236]|nr:hypothetical protein JCM19236_1276 [Vibrio sp. JCM 19236]
MLREGAEFLMEYRTDQLHNHEMKINATIGVIGMILDEQSYLDFALNTDYGIHYQLNHGATPEGCGSKALSIITTMHCRPCLTSRS